MKTTRWLSIVVPAGLLLGLMLGWASAQDKLVIDGQVFTVTYGDADMFAVQPITDQFIAELVASTDPTGQPTPWPHFKQHPQGWVPSCPSGMTLIRHDPPPDCVWGTKPLSQKPTQGDMECVAPAQASKLPACPKE
jgi:hypothetical protein